MLVDNAGIGADVPGGDVRQVSADGHELRFAVNYLAGPLLTQLLLPALGAAAAEAGSARIVLVASKGQTADQAHDPAARLRLRTISAQCPGTQTRS